MLRRIEQNAESCLCLEFHSFRSYRKYKGDRTYTSIVDYIIRSLEAVISVVDLKIYLKKHNGEKFRLDFTSLMTNRLFFVVFKNKVTRG